MGKKFGKQRGYMGELMKSVVEGGRIWLKEGIIGDVEVGVGERPGRQRWVIGSIVAVAGCGWPARRLVHWHSPQIMNKCSPFYYTTKSGYSCKIMSSCEKLVKL